MQSNKSHSIIKVTPPIGNQHGHKCDYCKRVLSFDDCMMITPFDFSIACQRWRCQLRKWFNNVYWGNLFSRKGLLFNLFKRTKGGKQLEENYNRLQEKYKTVPELKKLDT